MADLIIRATFSCRDCRKTFTEDFQGNSASSPEMFKRARELVRHCPFCTSRNIVHVGSDPFEGGSPPTSASP